MEAEEAEDGEHLLACSRRLPPEWERTSAAVKRWTLPAKAEREAWLGFSQVGFTRGESRDTLLCSPSCSCSPPYSRPSPQHKNLRAALNPLGVLRLPASQAQRCFCAEISGRGAVCVLGQTCPSFDTRADADSDWAANQDHSLSSPLLPPQSSPTHDMCHCHRSALEDTTS